MVGCFTDNTFFSYHDKKILMRAYHTFCVKAEMIYTHNKIPLSVALSNIMLSQMGPLFDVVCSLV